MFVEKLAKLPQSTRIVISAVVVVLPAAVCYSWIVVPHTKYLSATQQYGFVAGDLTMKNQVIRSKIILKKKELQELQQRLTQSREKFFTLQEARDFFREIEVVSNQAGCVVLSTEFFSNKYGLRPKSGRKTAEKASAIVSNSIAVTFTANYENVMAFLAKLLDRPQKVAVDLLEMTSASYSPSILQCKATFTIFVVDDKEIFSDE